MPQFHYLKMKWARGEPPLAAVDSTSPEMDPSASEAPTGGPENAEGGAGLAAGSLGNRLRLVGTALVAGLVLLVLGLNWIVLRGTVRREMEDAARSIAVLMADAIAPAVETQSRETAERVLMGLFRLDDAVFAGVASTDGRLLTLVGDPPREKLNARIPDSTESLRNGHLLVIRTPVRDSRLQPMGVLVVGFEDARRQRMLRSSALLFLVAGVAAAGVAFLIGDRLSRRLVAPLLELAGAVRRVGRGGEPVLLGVTRRDEIGLVQGAFNGMAERLQASRGDLERQRAELEETVRARTEELRRKNVALAVQNERVVEASRLKSDFVANMSHELRTPLNAILALSELLRDEITGPLQNDEQRQQLDLIRQGGENLLRLINDVLDLSRVEAGKVDLRSALTDTADLLRAVTEEMRPLVRRKGLELRLEAPESASLWFDADRVTQVLRNLIGNAVKFTERGWVRVAGCVDVDEERLTFWVEDTGIGVAPRDHEAVFQEFRQVDGSATRRHGGTGLGLAISRRLVRLMGGELALRSDLGQGATFTFWIPAFRERPEQLGAPGPASVLDLPEGSVEEAA
jgi:signal transduction histidine kinase